MAGLESIISLNSISKLVTTKCLSHLFFNTFFILLFLQYKLLGNFLSIVLSTVFGFSVADFIIVTAGGSEGVERYVAVVFLSLVLALVFLSIAVFAATWSRRKAKAFGIALMLWFFFVLFYDLLALGGSLMFRGRAANTFLFFSLFGNPVDMVRVASLIILDNVTIFGAAGAAMLRFLCGKTISLVLLVAGLTAWTLLPLLVSMHMLRRQDI